MNAEEARMLTESAIQDIETQQALQEEQETGDGELGNLVWLLNDSGFLYDVPEIIDEAIQIAAENGMSGLTIALTTSDVYDTSEPVEGNEVFADESGRFCLSKYNMGTCPQWTTTAMLWISLDPYTEQGMPEDEFGPALDIVSSIYEADGYGITRHNGVLRTPRTSKIERFVNKLLLVSPAQSIEYEEDELGCGTRFYTFAIAW